MKLDLDLPILEGFFVEKNNAAIEANHDEGL